MPPQEPKSILLQKFIKHMHQFIVTAWYPFSRAMHKASLITKQPAILFWPIISSATKLEPFHSSLLINFLAVFNHKRNFPTKKFTESKIASSRYGMDATNCNFLLTLCALHKEIKYCSIGYKVEC